MSDNAPKSPTATQMLRARQAEEGRKAMAEYEAHAVAVRERMAKLREMRLAKEAADDAAGVGAKPALKPASRAPRAAAKSGARASARAPKKATKAAAKGEKLSDWLDERNKGGHRT